MLLVLWWKRGRVAWRDVGALVPFFVLGITFGLWTAWLERYRVGAVGPEFDLTLIERCLIAGRALWFYAAKIVWPASLAFIYPRWVIDAGIWWQYLFPAGAAAAVGALWLTRKRLGRGPLAAVLFFAGTLLPALGFFNVYPHIYSFVADHFQYLASVGIIALVVSLGFGAAGRLGRRGSQAAAVAAAVVLAALGAVSWRQARVYTDLETLWRDTLHKNPGAWIAHNNLGNVLQADGRTDEAIDHYREALRFAPQYAEGYLNLCSALQRQGGKRFALTPTIPRPTTTWAGRCCLGVISMRRSFTCAGQSSCGRASPAPLATSASTCARRVIWTARWTISAGPSSFNRMTPCFRPTSASGCTTWARTGRPSNICSVPLSFVPATQTCTTPSALLGRRRATSRPR
jgi:tetratricopeptide (TPR) repeat protein